MTDLFRLPAWLTYTIEFVALVLLVAIIVGIKLSFDVATKPQNQQKLYWLILMIVIVVAILSMPVYLYWDSHI